MHTGSGLEALSRVLDLLAGLLDVALGLFGVTLGFERLVADGLSDGLLGLALGLLDLVLGLVGGTHCRSFPRRLSVPGPLCPEGTVLIRLARPAGVGSPGEGWEARRRRCRVVRTTTTSWDN